MPKYCNFDQIFTFVGALVAIPFTDLGQIWQETVDPWSTQTHGLRLHAKFHQDPFIVPPSRDKNHRQILLCCPMLVIVIM